MKFLETALKGVFEVTLEPTWDDRGFFARAWCEREFKSHRLETRLAQCNISFNTQRGTLRGIHFQAPPFEETKLVRCTRGSLYDVVVDLRATSPTFKKWYGAVLSTENRKMIYVPRGCAHGFLTLEENTEVFYQMSEFYEAASARGIRWNDSAFQVEWPDTVQVISERDRNYPDFK